jgi:hypothetical protein
MTLKICSHSDVHRARLAFKRGFFFEKHQLTDWEKTHLRYAMMTKKRKAVLFALDIKIFYF